MKRLVLAAMLVCVSAIGGITFHTQTDALLGGELGFNLHPNLEVYAA